MKLIDTLVSILYFKSFQSITKFEGHNGNPAYQKIYIYTYFVISLPNLDPTSQVDYCNILPLV